VGRKTGKVIPPTKPAENGWGDFFAVRDEALRDLQASKELADFL